MQRRNRLMRIGLVVAGSLFVAVLAGLVYVLFSDNEIAPVGMVSIIASADSTIVGGSLTFIGEMRDAAGELLDGREKLWSSSAPKIAVIDTSGVIIGISEGRTVITLLSEGVVTNLPIDILSAPVESVTLTPETATVVVGERIQLATIINDFRGNPVSGRDVRWSSREPNIASVDASSGLVTGIFAGTATIIAESEETVGEANITVNEAPVALVLVDPESTTILRGETIVASVTLRDTEGNVAGGRLIDWTSSDPEIATVDSVSGAVTGLVPGTAFITANSEGKSAALLIQVIPRPVASIVLSLSSPTIGVGEIVLPISVMVLDDQGNELHDRNVEWFSRDSGILTVDRATGEFTGVSAGSTVLTVTTEDRAANAIITVVAQTIPPSISVSQTNDSRGGFFQISGVGFPSSTRISITINLSGGGQFFSLFSDVNGAFETFVSIPRTTGELGSIIAIDSSGAKASRNVVVPPKISVPGNPGGWINTGLTVLAGDTLQITATGEIQFDSAGRTADPSGRPDGDPPGNNTLVPFVGSHTLVGRIGSTGSLFDQTGFFVGSSYNRVMRTSGELFLGFNDGYVRSDRRGLDPGGVGDNSGAYSVFIAIVKR
jgi:uncharacterized protein YjdB